MVNIYELIVNEIQDEIQSSFEDLAVFTNVHDNSASISIYRHSDIVSHEPFASVMTYAIARRSRSRFLYIVIDGEGVLMHCMCGDNKQFTDFFRLEYENPSLFDDIIRIIKELK